MKRILNKTITSLLILILLLVSCPITIIKSNAEEGTSEYETLEDYIATYEGNTLDYDSNGKICGIHMYEPAIIKDFSDISTYSDLNYIEIWNIDLGNLDNVQIPTTVNRIHISGAFEGTLNLTNNTNLEELYICEEKEEGLKNAVVDIRGLENIVSFTYSYSNTIGKYIFNEKVLMDDYSMVEEDSYEWEGIEEIRYDFNIYENLSDYFERELGGYNSKTEITEMAVWNYGLNIKDISDISEFPNLEYFEINIYKGLEDKIYSFSSNKKLKEIKISFDNQDLTNIVIDIRNMNWLKDFHVYGDFSNYKFVPEKNLLMDDYEILADYSYSNQYYYMFRIFDTVEEYLEWYGDTKDDIETFYVNGNGNIINDLSGLKELTNLRTLHITDKKIQDASFITELTNINKLYILDCELHTTLDLTNNSKLNGIIVSLKGDISDSCVDIRGLENIQSFNYSFNANESPNFDFNTCIKSDLRLRYYEYENGQREYYFNNNVEYYLNYGKISECELEDETTVVYGFELNDGKITVDEIINGDYLLDGIEIKIYNSNYELLSGNTVVGSDCKIQVFLDGEFKREFTVLIMGDTTGDGEIGASDALAIIKNKNEKLLIDNLVLEAAGKITRKSYFGESPTAVHALAIIKYLNGKYDIEQYYWGNGKDAVG